jgi:response regulator RpfG family c-di-GMP phosphodiesterase
MSDNDDLVFWEEEDISEPKEEANQSEQVRWKVILVDDEEAVHNVTTMALDDFGFDGKSLEFFHAYNGDDAKVLIREHPDTAIMLLDVVMEREHAGLEVAEYIREELKNKTVRIILRTGQPGQAPERDVIVKYDINDYKEKTELTSQKLFTLMCASLRSYRDIIALERNKLGLERVIESSADIFGLTNIRQFTEGVLSQLTSLLHIDSSAAYMKADGFAVSETADGLKVLAATGDYEKVVGEDARKTLAGDILEDIAQAIKLKKSYYRADRFVGYFSTAMGSTNILYLSGLRPLSEIDRSLMEVFARNISIAYENIDLHYELEDTQREIVYMLGEAVETRSKETGNHVKRVAEICKFLALKYGLSEETAEIIKLASPLHDVGKIGIPDAVLNKPGKLTPEEWEIMQTHAQLGHDMLKSSQKRILKASAIIARDHHEKWNGTGYPAAKSGEKIHLFGRIAAIADVYDALGNERCYKEAWQKDAVIAHMSEQSGKHFEPQLVDILISNIADIEAICAAFQDT